MANESAVLSEFCEAVARTAIECGGRARETNLLSEISWPRREQIRAIEGHFEKIEGIAQSMLIAVGTPEAQAIEESLWFDGVDQGLST